MVSTSAAPAVAILPANTQCNNVTGLSRCADGTACFRNNAVYSECRSSCPSSWACQTDVAGLNQQCGGNEQSIIYTRSNQKYYVH